MNKFGQVVEFFRKNWRLCSIMTALALLAVILAVAGMLNALADSTTIRVRYSDIGSYQGEKSAVLSEMGYQYGGAAEIWAFVVLAVILGWLHNVIALRLLKKRGEGAAMAWLALSIGLVIAALIVLLRLAGER